MKLIGAVKIWGTTFELFSSAVGSVHYLFIHEGGYCSEHRHAQKENRFYIITGTLKLTVWEREGRAEYILFEGGQHCIPIGVWHKFTAITDVQCVETYDYKYDGVDIERRTIGGLK